MNEDRYINARAFLQDLKHSRHILGNDAVRQVERLVKEQKQVDMLGRDIGAEPLLEGHLSAWHEMHSDGHGEFHTREYLSWTCPKCGWFVGELYSGHGRWHIQGETSYCARCGQKIDWSKPSAEEKRRYEERKAKEREEWMRRKGIPLDNMHEGMRKKFLREATA